MHKESRFSQYLKKGTLIGGLLSSLGLGSYMAYDLYRNSVDDDNTSGEVKKTTNGQSDSSSKYKIHISNSQREQRRQERMAELRKFIHNQSLPGDELYASTEKGKIEAGQQRIEEILKQTGLDKNLKLRNVTNKMELDIKGEIRQVTYAGGEISADLYYTDDEGKELLLDKILLENNGVLTSQKTGGDDVGLTSAIVSSNYLDNSIEKMKEEGKISPDGRVIADTDNDGGNYESGVYKDGGPA